MEHPQQALSVLSGGLECAWRQLLEVAGICSEGAKVHSGNVRIRACGAGIKSGGARIKSGGARIGGC